MVSGAKLMPVLNALILTLCIIGGVCGLLLAYALAVVAKDFDRWRE